MLKDWRTRFVGLFDPAGVKKYVTQVSLILLSLLIATRAERCRDAGKDREKLKEYLKAIQVDIDDEIETDKMNLNDCERDEECLLRFFQLCNQPSSDSILSAYSNFAEVYQRGVFRAFPPTTFDIMVQTGDANLLKDLQLRKHLASVFAFRQNTIRKDLESYDEQTQLCADKLGHFFDHSYMLNGQGRFLLDKEGFLKDPHNEVFLLLRNASLRGFHLDNAIEDLQSAKTELDAFLKKL